MNKNIIVTGGAKRGGAAICEAIHKRGYDVLIHCRESSIQAANSLSVKLNTIRPESAKVWCFDLSSNEITTPPESAYTVGLVANASEYVKSNIDDFSSRLARDIQIHLTGHLNLIRALHPQLRKSSGSIVAIGDIRIHRPKNGYLTYQIAKGALDSAVRSLAVELAPEIRINIVAPGPLEWPVNPPYSEERKERIIAGTPLGRAGRFDELASAVCFLLFDATFTTGATIPVDGGRSIQLT